MRSVWPHNFSIKITQTKLLRNWHCDYFHILIYVQFTLLLYFVIVKKTGLYYSPKEKVKTLKELVCLATFDTNEVYIGLNWKKKYKSPTDYCFAIKHPRLQQPKSVKFIKFLCADDQHTLERWLTAMRIAKVFIII